ncbi:hypothetical protein EHS39_09005 [Ensifer sp. MPMI2T]|nr:hypothetical protein EHS39_09005 [Ensifer sp. MPMI2T]
MSETDISDELQMMMRMGTVSSSEWQAYTWKNELAVQKSRIIQLIGEAISDDETEHNPYHMLERAIGIAAVCMRRLLECRLVTDRFRDSQLTVHEVYRKKDGEWREPFFRNTAGEIFNNYDLTSRHRKTSSPKIISDKMLHARVIGILSGSVYMPDGLLIASDTQSRKQLFHFTSAEIAAVFDAFLTDRVRIEADGYVGEGTIEVFAKRD